MLDFQAEKDFKIMVRNLPNFRQAVEERIAGIAKVSALISVVAVVGAAALLCITPVGLGSPLKVKALILLNVGALVVSVLATSVLLLLKRSAKR